MTKIALAMFVGLLCAGADALAAPQQTNPASAHHTQHRHRHTARAARPEASATLATSPISSAASSPAPVPNEAVTAPIDNSAQQTKVAPSVFSLHYPNQGDGYVTGSSPQAMDDRNAARATGVQMSVPLPQ